MAELSSIIREAAARYGLSPQMMLRIAQIESGMNPNAANPSSSARGVYQFLTKPGGSWEQYGAGKDPLDPYANVDAGARYIRDNAQALRSKLGREPADWEVYLAHQQGRGGAPALLSNPNQRAVDALAPLYKNPATARDAVVLNAGRENMTAGDFANLWKAKYEGTAVPPTAGGAVVPDRTALVGPAAVPAAVAPVRDPALGSIFADFMPQQKKQLVDPRLAVRKPRSVDAIIGELGQPVRLSV